MREDREEKPEKIEGKAQKLPSEAFEDEPIGGQPLSIVIRILLFWGGVVAPLICHAMALNGVPMGPEWQSGLLKDKLAFAIAGSSGYPMYPLLGFCIVSMTVYLYDQNLKHFVGKLGIYSGILVALWYLFLFDLVINETTGWPRSIFHNLLMIVVAAGFAAVIVGIIKLAHNLSPSSQVTEYTRQFSKYVLMALLLFFLLGLALSRGGLFFLALFFTLYFGVYWALLTYSYVSFRVFRDSSSLSKNFSLLQFLTTVSWLGAFMGMCRVSVMASMVEYSKLPLEPPSGCYVVTAAARGHAWFVKADDNLCQRFPVNRQLCRLKAFEIVVKSIWPRAHRLFRKIYDTLGPIVANRLSNRLFADLAYVSLKPVEWIAAISVRVVVGKTASQIVSQLYKWR